MAPRAAGHTFNCKFKERPSTHPEASVPEFPQIGTEPVLKCRATPLRVVRRD